MKKLKEWFLGFRGDDMSKYRVNFLNSGNFFDIDESEVEQTKKFYKLKFFVYDEHLQKFTDVITNARNDIFLFKLKPVNV